MPAWEPLPEELAPFPMFLAYILRELGLSDEPTLSQLEIGEWLLMHPRQITFGFRGISKSFVGSSVYALWRLRHDPFNEKVLVPAQTADKALEVAKLVQQCIRDIDILRCLEPGPGMRSSIRAFDVGPANVMQECSMRALGILSPALTGKRATLALPDDIETLNNTITPHKRSRLKAAVTELEACLKPGEADFDFDAPLDFQAAGQRQVFPRQILYFGTPHLETSLYWQLVNENKYKIRIWPARYPDPLDQAGWDCYQGCLEPRIAEIAQTRRDLIGTTTEPERFSDEDLLEREQGMSRQRWQLQFMLNCQLATADKFPIRLGDLVVMDLSVGSLPEVVVWGNGEECRAQDLICTGLGADRWYHKPASVGGWVRLPGSQWQCVLFVDPAGRGHDELSWSVVAQLHGNLFLLENGGTARGYDNEVLLALANMAKRWRVSLVRSESNYGDGMFTKLLEPVLRKVYPCSIDEEKSGNQQKEHRIIDVLAPVVQQHRLVVNRSVIQSAWIEAESDPETGHARSLAYQLSRITTERNSLEWKDRADSLAGAVSYFTSSVALDQKHEQRRRAEEVREHQLRCFLDTTGAGVQWLAAGLTEPLPSPVSEGISRLKLPC